MSYANVKKCINENWTVRMQKKGFYVALHAYINAAYCYRRSGVVYVSVC